MVSKADSSHAHRDPAAKYLTFSLKTLRSQWQPLQLVKIPPKQDHIDTIHGLDDSDSTLSSDSEASVQTDAIIQARGQLIRILARREDNVGKVFYTALWQDGTETEEPPSVLRHYPDILEEYEHRILIQKGESHHTDIIQEVNQEIVLEPAISKRSKRQRSRAWRVKRIIMESSEDDQLEDSGDNRDTSDSAMQRSSSQSSDEDGYVSQQLKENRRKRRSQNRQDQNTTQRDTQKEAIEKVLPEMNLSLPSDRRSLPSSLVLEYNSSFISHHWDTCSKCNAKGYPNHPPEKQKKRTTEPEQKKLIVHTEQRKRASDSEQRKRITKLDTFTFHFDEEEHFRGRLLQCITCACATDEGCLPATFKKKNMIKCLIHGEESLEYQCSYCSKSANKTPENLPSCDGCHEVHPVKDIVILPPSTKTQNPDDTSSLKTGLSDSHKGQDVSMDIDTPPDTHILFRCIRCHRGYHYNCLPPFPDEKERLEGITDKQEIIGARATLCQRAWSCPECITYKSVETIVNWRPILQTGNEQETPVFDPDHSHEFLVKWKGSSYNDLVWVPQPWLQSVAKQKFKNYCEQHVGTPLRPTDMIVPKEWRTVDRILAIKTEGSFVTNSIEKVTDVFAKFSGLSYDQAVWDKPPPKDSDLYEVFVKAFERYKVACRVLPPKRMKAHVEEVQEAATNESYTKHEIRKQPGFIVGGNLMPHQMDGLNWLVYQWERKQACVLADDMGLGKTIQIVSFLSFLFNKFKIYPFLIVVPNSTATNWLREFEKWAPNMVVVPFHGSSESRKLARDYELFRSDTPPNIRCHVVITTNESAMAEAALLGRISFWPVLVVDEAHRLKNNTSLLFQKLQSLKYGHTVLLTGTPLQNNIRELINIMHFADPKKFADIEGLEESFSELTNDTVQELHEHLKPYFLRRTKQAVLKTLPPKSEIIVPLSMTKLQKDVYKSIISKRLIAYQLNDNAPAKLKKSSMNNILMELRKTLNHPYLVSGVEVKQPDEEQTQRALIEAGNKLKMLHQMLPKLKAQGHRVLIFSTMKLTLDVLEDYLIAEGYTYVRLDGDSNQTERVRNIDAFNAKDSDIFIFLLTTKAGGVGINLATADTVIIWDFDFNPHSDLQAISRAHRIGQTKPVLVLRFMTRLSVEEKIAQVAKKKMVLDHLVVEKMDDDELEASDIESILKFGTNALFEGDDSKDIVYDSAAIDKLLDRSHIVANEKENTDENEQGNKPMSFSFAKIWNADKSDQPLEELDENKENAEDDDFWSRIIKQKEELQAKMIQEEALGRGARKRTQVRYFNVPAPAPAPAVNTSKKKAKGKEKATAIDLGEIADEPYELEGDDINDTDFVDLDNQYPSDDEYISDEPVDEPGFSIHASNEFSGEPSERRPVGGKTTAKRVDNQAHQQYHPSFQPVQLASPGSHAMQSNQQHTNLYYNWFLQWKRSWNEQDIQTYSTWENYMQQHQPNVRKEDYWFYYLHFHNLQKQSRRAPTTQSTVPPGQQRPENHWATQPSAQPPTNPYTTPPALIGAEQTPRMMHQTQSPDNRQHFYSGQGLTYPQQHQPYNTTTSSGFTSPHFTHHQRSPHEPPSQRESGTSYPMEQRQTNERHYQNTQQTAASRTTRPTKFIYMTPSSSSSSLPESPSSYRPAQTAFNGQHTSFNGNTTSQASTMQRQQQSLASTGSPTAVSTAPKFSGQDVPHTYARTTQETHLDYTTQRPLDLRPGEHSRGGGMAPSQQPMASGSQPQHPMHNNLNVQRQPHFPSREPSQFPMQMHDHSPNRQHPRERQILCIICNHIHDQHCPQSRDLVAIGQAYNRINQLPISPEERHSLRLQLDALQQSLTRK